MSWLNFNDSLNSLKGQITNLAQSVLTEEDDEGSIRKPNEYEELKNICLQQERELARLRQENEDFQKQNIQENESWNWVNNDDITNSSSIEVSELKREIGRLQNENKDLIGQLEQLDSDNQQNVGKLVEVKTELQAELQKSKAAYSELERDYNSSLVREESFRNESIVTRSLLEEEIAKQKKKECVFEIKYNNLVEEFKKVTADLTYTKDQLETFRNNEKHEMEVDLQKAKESYSELKQLYEASILKEKQQQEEINNILQLHEEEMNKLRKLKDEEVESKFLALVKEHEKPISKEADPEKLVSFKKRSSDDTVTAGNEVTTCITNHEQFSDGGLDSRSDEQYSTGGVNSFVFLKTVFERYEKNLEHLSEVVKSLKSQYETKELEKIGNVLCNLREQCKCLEEQNELIESSYFNNEAFKDHLDSVVLLGSQKRIESIDAKMDALSETEKETKVLVPKTRQEIDNWNDSTRETGKVYVEKIREIFEDLKRSENPSRSPDFPSNNELCELTDLLREMYDFMFELKSKVIFLSDSNINIITEKNQEIERLVVLSDHMTQEILEKSQTVIEYGNEITELSKNNELLIADLEVYKNTHLETISEIDEDKTILLEEQLDRANVLIKELQTKLDKFEENAILHSSDLLDSKIEEEDNTYLELLNKHEELQIECEIMKRDCCNIENQLQSVVAENASLKSSLDSLKANSENLVYIQDELKTFNESLQSDVEHYMKKVDELVETNSKLNADKEDYDNLKNEFGIMAEKIKKEEEGRNGLEEKVSQLTEKLQRAKVSETSLKLQYDTLNKDHSNLTGITTKLEENIDNCRSSWISLQEEYQHLKIENEKLAKQNENLSAIMKNLEETKTTTEQLVVELQKKISDESEKQLINVHSNENTTELMNNNQIDELHQIELENSKLKNQLEILENSKTELIQLVTSKHQESISYHNEIQRLNQILSNESQKSRDFETQTINLKAVLASENKENQTNLEKLREVNVNLKEQCDLLSQSLLEEQGKVARLMDEKSNPSEAEISLKKKLERLQTHLVELEEHYTGELYEAEQKNLVLQSKVNEIEEREKSSSTMYTSVNIRANQQVESLQNQLQAMTGERDSLRKQISDLEDTINKQAAALTNLQLVLEQFRKDKEKEVHKETERIRRQINAEKKIQVDLRNEIVSLKAQLEERKQGLLAAARLSDQLENSKTNLASLKEEVSQLQSNLATKQDELNAALSQTDGKVDKSLIKNLVIGFVCCNNHLNKDQTQILKIIGTVLDFNQQDHDKLNLNKGLQGSWLNTILSPQVNLHNVGQESLSRAFIEFLENESKPRVVPSLLNANGDTPKPASSRSSTPRQSPANLSEIVLPTFADFAQNRNSSSILKDVLKDHS